MKFTEIFQIEFDKFEYRISTQLKCFYKKMIFPKSYVDYENNELPQYDILIMRIMDKTKVMQPFTMLIQENKKQKNESE